jgi:flagellar motor switch protein FliM
MDLEFEYLNSEVNPQFANIVSPTEVVVVCSFHIELDGGGGDLHVTMPYSMIEPMRELLDAGIQSDRSEVDERWIRALRDEVKVAEVELSSNAAETTLSLEDVMNLKPGDIIPVELPEIVLVRAEGIPVLRGPFRRVRWQERNQGGRAHQARGLSSSRGSAVMSDDKKQGTGRGRHG